MGVEWREDHFVIDEATEDRLKKVYPMFYLELAKMEVWYLANPRKQKKNHHTFIVKWLNRVMRDSKNNSATPAFVGRDYTTHNQDFKKIIEKAKVEAAPPPDEWKKLMHSLKGKR